MGTRELDGTGFISSTGFFFPSVLTSTHPNGPPCTLFLFPFVPAIWTCCVSALLHALVSRALGPQCLGPHPGPAAQKADISEASQPASPLARRGTRSPSVFNEVWVLIHIMETEMEKPSRSLLQKQSLSTLRNFRVESTSLLMKENSDRNSGWAGQMGERRNGMFLLTQQSGQRALPSKENSSTA